MFCRLVLKPILSPVGAHYREARHKDVAEIMEGTMHFNTSHLDPNNFVDHLFWMGDLNYRMVYSFESKEEPSFEVQWDFFKALVSGAKWDELHVHDELIHERELGNVFAGFREDRPHFPPTFKVERAVGFNYNKQRLPAWCDRVLWRSLPNRIDDVRIVSYEAIPAVSTSDHKPVQAVFIIDLPTPPYLQETPLTKQMAPTAGCLIIFRELLAYDMPKMDVTSENDCYVIFLSKTLFFSSAKYSTKPKDNEVSPRWSESEIPLLVTRFANLDALRDECLILAVLDADMVHDDIIGFTELNLNDILRYQRGMLHPPFLPFKFKQPLLFRGQHRGFIEGSVEIQNQVASV